MTDSPSTHWTTDEHLLAQYVLGRLDAQQAVELAKHLRECPQCRDAVAAEEQLAAGVRRAGRDTLKQRLAQRLGQKRSATNWYRVAGIAAAFIVLLTVGIYNKWFFSGETRLADSGLKSDSITQKTEQTPQQLAPVQQSPEKMQLADVSKPSATDRDRAELKGVGGRSDELEKKKRDGGGEKRGAVSVPVPVAPENAVSITDQMMAAAAEHEGIWVEGRIVSGDANVPAEGKAMDKRTEDVRENAPKGKKEPTALMSFAARSRPLPTEGPAVVVTQRPTSDLPRNQIRGKQNLSQVQTLLRSDASGLSMVLYSDSLLNRTDLSQARLQTIREDSIILQIGNQRIGYRLPPGSIDQLAKQLKKAK
jgi:hypothetical protein